MATPSLARNFYDQIVNNPDPFMAIRRLVNSNPPTLESDHFDCKLEHQDQKQREKKSKELWSEVLGGFANGGGGVLIWGLDARKHKIDGREIDAVCGEELIANPRALEARLRELQRQATDPPLGGVEIMAIPVQDDDSKGFVICFIPDGPFKPYRSEQAGQQYYIRAGDTTQVMPRSVLSAMFFPRYNAVFNVRAELTYKQIKTAIKLFPNPSNAGSVQLILSETTTFPVTVKLYSSSGSIIFQKELYDFYNTILTDKLPNGLYIISVEKDGVVESLKLQIIK